MKKLLLSLVGCVVAVSAMALDIELKPAKHLRSNPNSFKTVEATNVMPLVSASSRATETMPFSPAADPYQAVQFQDVKAGMIEACALEFTAENATSFAGNVVKNITFWTGIDQRSTNTNRFSSLTEATVFMTNDIQEAPFFTKKVTLPGDAFTQISVALDEPMTIEAGKGFYVGYYFAIPNETELPIVIDGIGHAGEEGGWVALANAGATFEELTWQNIADQVGFLCIGMTLEGDKLPKNSADMVGIQTQPVAEADKSFDCVFALTNSAANKIDNISLQVKVGSAEPIIGEMEIGGLPYGMTVQGALSLSTTETGMIPVEITIIKVNGEDNNSATPSIATEIEVIAAGTGFKRRVLMEEFTGAWCGYCPMGIVACEYARENLENELIPVGIHSDDAMQSSYSTNLINTFNDGSFPSVVLNRMYSADVELEGLLEMYDYVSNIPARGKLECSGRVSGDSIYIDAETTFAMDMEDAAERYILSFEITQDNVGPYNQTNYFSNDFQMKQWGQIMLELEGWNEKPYEVETIYDDVFRYVTAFRGHKGSIPESVKAGETYTWNYGLKWRQLKTFIKQIDENGGSLNLVGILMDKNTLEVENAFFYQLYHKDGDTGVNDIVVEDANAPVEYYNLQGVRVANPENGLYIRRQGNTATKVFIR